MKKIYQNIILLIATVAICALLFELGLRIAAHMFPRFACSTFSELDDVFLCQLEFRISNSFSLNQSIVMADQDICDKVDNELGWVPKQDCRTSKYSTNSQGFRGAKEFTRQKSKQRIIALGDSFTWGENNKDNETYPFYLEKMYNNNVDVINMGVHGYGPDQFYLYFLRDGLKYSPDVVLFGLFLPDIHRTILKVRDYYKPRFIFDNGRLVLDQSSMNIPDLQTAILKSAEVKKKPRIYSFSFLYELYSKFARLATAYSEEASLTLKIIEDMNDKLKKENIKLVVVLIPEQEMIEKNNADYYGVVPKITQALESKGIAYINLQPELKRETEAGNESLYIGHLKPIGNYAVANIVFNELNKKKLLHSGK